MVEDQRKRKFECEILPVRYMEADKRLAWLPTRIRKLPISGLTSGVEPSVVAIECTTGNTMPPPRAVLLGTKGAKINSIKEFEYIYFLV